MIAARIQNFPAMYVVGGKRRNPTWSKEGTSDKHISDPCPRSSLITLRSTPRILTTLAFWLRSSVVSVLHRLTSMIGAPPLLFGYLIFAALALELCLHLLGTMTLPLHCRLVSSGDPFIGMLFSPPFAILHPLVIWQGGELPRMV
jgi:hypothetical protein